MSQLSKVQRNIAVTDYYSRNMGITEIVNKYFRITGSSRHLLEVEIMELINQNKHRDNSNLPFQKVLLSPLGNKDNSYFEDENSYGTIPNYTLEEMLEDIA